MPRPAPVTMATFPETMLGINEALSIHRPSCPGHDEGVDPLTSPHLARDVTDHAQLGPLFVFGEDIAFLGGGEAALWRQAELVEIGELGGFLNAAFDGVLCFELAALRRHQA